MNRGLAPLLMLVMVMALFAPVRAATPGVDAPPEPGPPRPLVLPPVSEQTLAGGLKLLVVPRAGLPLVTAALYVRAGREVDPADRAGLSILTGNLLVKGALRDGREIAAPQIAREAEALGSTLDVSTSWRVTSLQMTVTPPKLDAALALIAEAARAPLLRSDELDRARTLALDGLRVSLANPGDVAALAARRAFWGASPYGASMTPASLERLQRSDVQAFHARWYRPGNSLLVLAGDVTASQALAFASRHFEAWRGDGPASEPIAGAPPLSIADSSLLIEMPGSGQSGVMLVAPFAALRAPDRRIGEVAAALVGGGYSARLNQEIRIKRGLSYGAFGGGESQVAGGMFIARTQTQNSTAMQVAQLMRDELLRMGREEAPGDELDARKATLVGSFARQLDTTQGLADQVASQWFQGRPLAELARYVDEVMAVTPAQVREFAAKHWTPSALRTVIAGDVPAATESAASAASAASADPRPLRIPIATLDLEQSTLVKR